MPTLEEQLAAADEQLMLEEAEALQAEIRDKPYLDQIKKENALDATRGPLEQRIGTAPPTGPGFGEAMVSGGLFPALSPDIFGGLQGGLDSMAGMVLGPYQAIKDQYADPQLRRPLTLPNQSVADGIQSLEIPRAYETANQLGAFSPQDTMPNELDPEKRRKEFERQYYEHNFPAFLHAAVQDGLLNPVVKGIGSTVFGTLNYMEDTAKNIFDSPEAAVSEFAGAMVPVGKKPAKRVVRYAMTAGMPLARGLVNTLTEEGFRLYDPQSKFSQSLAKDGNAAQRFAQNSAEWTMASFLGTGLDKGGKFLASWGGNKKATEKVKARAQLAGVSSADWRKAYKAYRPPSAEKLAQEPGLANELIQDQLTKAILRAEKAGMYDKYTSPKEYMAELVKAQQSAFKRRAEILAKGDIPLGDRIAGSDIVPDLNLPITRTALNEALVSNPKGAKKGAIEEIIEQIANVVDNRLTTPEAQKAALDLGRLSPAEYAKLQPRTGTRRLPKKPGETATYFNKGDNPNVFYTGEFTPLKTQANQPFSPEAAPPKTAQLADLMDLRQDLGNASRLFWLKEKDAKAFPAAAQMAAARQEVNDTIESYLDKLVSSKRITAKEAKDLRKTDRIIETTNILMGPANRWTAANEPTTGVSKLPTLIPNVTELYNRFSTQRAASVMADPKGPGYYTTSAALGGGAERVGNIMKPFTEPLANPMVQGAAMGVNAANDFPMIFPRSAEEFFAMPPEEISQSFPDAVGDIESFRRKDIKLQRELVARIAQQRPDLFEESPIPGFNVVDGRIAPEQRAEFIEKLRKPMRDPRADKSYYAKLIQQVADDEPILPPRTNSPASLRRLANSLAAAQIEFDVDIDDESEAAQDIANN